jgi:acyl-CoA dehydrogenase
MEKTNLNIIDWLLSESRSMTPKTYPEFDSFRKALYIESKLWSAPVDRAVVGGFVADCIAFAFAAGYCSAMQSLLPALPENAITCFCISEEGGGHPRAIKSQLVPLPSETDQKKTFTLNGKKKYITCAKEADLFLVAASDGIRDDGTNSLRMMKLDSKTQGISIVPMKNLHIVPEISHCELIFTDVNICESDLLPGDGYTDYIKPFRTIEDLHISAGILGYLFKNACIYDWGTDVKESILGRIASVRNLALNNPGAPAVHIVTGDLLKQIKKLLKRLEPFWEKVGGKAKKDWDRDKILMNIADKARIRRSQTAWKFYEGKRKD